MQDNRMTTTEEQLLLLILRNTNVPITERIKHLVLSAYNKMADKNDTKITPNVLHFRNEIQEALKNETIDLGTEKINTTYKNAFGTILDTFREKFDYVLTNHNFYYFETIEDGDELRYYFNNKESPASLVLSIITERENYEDLTGYSTNAKVTLHVFGDRVPKARYFLMLELNPQPLVVWESKIKNNIVDIDFNNVTFETNFKKLQKEINKAEQLVLQEAETKVTSNETFIEFFGEINESADSCFWDIDLAKRFFNKHHKDAVEWTLQHNVTLLLPKETQDAFLF